MAKTLSVAGLLAFVLVTIWSDLSHAGLRETFRACENGYLYRMQNARKVIQPGSAEEQYCLALGYGTGYGILPRDPAAAVPWLQKAASQNHPGAMGTLAFHYQKGIGVGQNTAEAVRLYEGAAALGNADAMFDLYSIHAGGLGVRKDPAKAQKWLQMAASKGHPKARQIVQKQSRRQASLPGQSEFDNGKALYDRKNYAAAATQFRRSAQMGNSRGQVFLGLLYEDGLGVEKNFAEAAKWYRLAAEQGHSTAQKAIGQMYEDAKGVRENWAEAVKWYQKSAAQADPEGIFALGRMYQFGMGVPQNTIKAMELFEDAADHVGQAAYFARHIREGGCVGHRNQWEWDRYGGECHEPTGRVFRNSQERTAWLSTVAAWVRYQGRKFDYDECLRGDKPGLCLHPGPAPQQP